MGVVSTLVDSPDRRWLLIQVQRARIAHLLRSGRRHRGSEIAERMNAIALLCDRGRTERGRALARRLAKTERDAGQPIVADLLASEPVELTELAPSGGDGT